MRRTQSVAIILGVLATSCKFQSNSELKATPEQKEKLRSCIVSTVLATFPEAKKNPGAVRDFALELSAKAPSSNNTAKDPAFEEYVTSLGCDPSRSTGTDNYGLTIVEQWVASPHNKQDIGPKDSTATQLRKLRLNSQAN